MAVKVHGSTRVCDACGTEELQEKLRAQGWSSIHLFDSDSEPRGVYDFNCDLCPSCTIEFGVWNLKTLVLSRKQNA